MNLTQILGVLTKRTGKHPFPEHMQDARRIASDGIVLLKNENRALPIKESQVALFGAGAVDTIVCGTGSGYVMAPYTVNVRKGLENAGIRITSTAYLDRFLKESKRINKEDKTLSKLDRMWSGLSILIDEIPITEEELKEAGRAATAVYVIRRNAGENKDRRCVKGDYYLSDIEEENIRKVAAQFKHTIVVLNTSVIDANFLNDIPGINGALLLGQAGMEAGNALADILLGKISPSGHLTDTWAGKYTDNPASATFGANDGNVVQEDYIEDIYVGYRYFDTFGIEPLFPFGYGLSYSECTRELVDFSVNWEQVTMKIKMKNIGTVSARFVTQIYVTAPPGTLAKPYQELKGYGKTKELEAGEEEILTIVIPTESLTSYDTEQAAFVMESGTYLFRMGEDSKRNEVAASLFLDEEAIVRKVTNQLTPDHELQIYTTPEECVKKVLREIEEAKRTVMEGSTKSAVLAASDCVTKNGVVEESIESDEFRKRNAEETKTSIQSSSITFIDVVEGRATMDAFIDSLDEEVLFRLVTGAADETKHTVPKRTKGKYKPVGGPSSSGSTTALYVDSLGIPNWKVTDGPSGCHLPFCGVTGYPVGMVIAQTWDNEMAKLAGLGIGKELKAYKHSIILGPGMNIHRDPLCGRNFEYYSEDPFVSGKMAAATTIGVQHTKGTGVAIKHFATNNQEEDRLVENNTVSERALREIYLRGFEICVKEAEPKTVMTSYNCLNGTHTSSSYELITNILRGEWNFKGLVMSDWGSKSEKHLDLKAGNDLIMGGYRSEFLKSAVHGTPAEFAEDGYVRVQEFKVFGGFFKNEVEFWNSFQPDAEGTDVVETTVAAGRKLSDKIQQKVEEGVASVRDNPDGSKTVSYKGWNRGAILDIEDIKKCAKRTLEQIADSVSYEEMMK